jgi:hypothetical protein
MGLQFDEYKQEGLQERNAVATWEIENQLSIYLKNSLAFSPQANYTDPATAACRRS